MHQVVGGLKVLGGCCCFGCLVLAAVFLALMAALGFWIWAFADCLAHETRKDRQRRVWTLVIVFVPVLGGLLYLILRRSARKRELGE